MANQLHITVVAHPNANGSLTTEAQLLKAALLYADEVTLCSPALSILADFYSITQLSEDDRIAFITQVSPVKDSNVNPTRINSAYHMYKTLRKKKYGYTRKEREFMEHFHSFLIQDWEKLAEHIEEVAAKAGISTIEPALASGLVKLQPLDFSAGVRSDSFTHQFQEFLSKAIVSHETYPLFDDGIAKLVQASIEEGVIKPSQARTRSSRHVGLSKEVLQRLPLFDEAPVDELLDIREELSPYLVRFRAAMIEYSKAIESAVWDQDFPIEAQQIFLEKIAPAIVEIEEATKSNSLLRNLLYKVATDPKVVGPMLAVIIAQPLDFSNLIGQIASAVPAVLGAAGSAELLKDVAETISAWNTKNQDIQQNHLYMMYRAQQLLTK